MEEEKLNNLIYLLRIHHIDSEPLENLIEEYKKIEKQIDLEWVENNYIEKSKYNELVKRNKELEEENRIYKSQLNSAFDNGFISKSKVREKIEEANEKITNEFVCETYKDRYEFLKNSLQELLQDKE